MNLTYAVPLAFQIQHQKYWAIYQELFAEVYSPLDQRIPFYPIINF
jgi:hypothetical protein